LLNFYLTAGNPNS